jgi:hypothetical protein
MRGKANKRKKMKPKPEDPKSIRRMQFLFGGILIAGTGLIIYRTVKKGFSKETPSGSSDLMISENNNSEGSYVQTVSSSVSNQVQRSVSEGFPLKQGSRGTLVSMLQKALSKNIPSLKIDGQFGPATAAALKAAGYSSTIDEGTFSSITGSNAKVVFNPLEIAKRLYSAVQRRSLNDVLSILKELKSVQDYSSVNEHYKKLSLFVSKTIVNDLLNYVFKNSEEGKKQIRNEFLRIGLKVSSEGTWSLQGIPLYKDLITIRGTIVTDGSEHRIPVRKNTILGDEVRVANGQTWFRALDNKILTVPTQDVKYT